MAGCAPVVVLGTKKDELDEGLGPMGEEGDAGELLPLSIPPTLEAPTSWNFSVALVFFPPLYPSMIEWPIR